LSCELAPPQAQGLWPFGPPSPKGCSLRTRGNLVVVRAGLTLLCITRDQAPKLMRMLQSVQGVADDIIVVDTGSKDLSPGIARMHGARVFEIEWPGSFSDALNEAMRQVETEWTLRLDTDEWLLPESGPQIRRLVLEEASFGYYLIRQDLSDEYRYSESWLLRMWRSHPLLRFEGVIHEYFPDEVLTLAANGRKIHRAPVPFRHDGFVGGNSEAKLRRNIVLLRQELDLRPGQLYHEIELANSMAFLQEPGAERMVEHLADRLLEEFQNERPEPFTANLIGTALGLVKRRELDAVRTHQMIDFSWHWFDACPPLLWSIGQIELRRKNLPGIYRALLRLEDLSESGEYEREWTFDARILQEALWDSLSQVSSSLGHTEVSRRNRDRLARLQQESG